jgi:methanethiol S-methyltransferase
MNHEQFGYGLWSLAIINSAVFIFFAFTFFKPQSKRDWRSFGAFSAFLVALFTEMYGFPLTIYLLSGWLQTHYPDVDWFSHDAGHLLEMMFGWKTDPHAGPFHILSYAFIGAGFIVIRRVGRCFTRLSASTSSRRQGSMPTSGIRSI